MVPTVCAKEIRFLSRPVSCFSDVCVFKQGLIFYFHMNLHFYVLFKCCSCLISAVFYYWAIFR